MKFCVALMATAAELLDGSSRRKQNFTGEIFEGLEEHLDFYQYYELSYDFDGVEFCFTTNCEARHDSSVDEDSSDDHDKGNKCMKNGIKHLLR